MAALKDHNAPETKVCNACGLPRAREAYGSKQWKARSVRRCTECATADRPVRAKAPPVPVSSAPAPARRSAPLTPEEKESASRLSDGAPLTYRLQNNLMLAAAEAPPFVMPRVSEGSEPELRRLGRSLGLRMNAKHYFFEDNENNPGYGDVANMECIAADVSLAGVKFAFDRQYSAMTECDMGSLELICLLKKGRPFVIFKVGAGENSGCDAEATVAEIEQLSRKLGLERASPAELVATLLAAICPNFLAWPPCYCEDYGGGYFDVSRESHPILTEAIGMLADPWRRRGSDKPGVPPESGKTSFRALLAGAASKMREVSSSDSDGGGESGAFIENPFHPENVRVLSFMEEWRPRVEAQEPSLTSEQVSLRLANIWRSLSDAQKAKYIKPHLDEEATEPEEAPSGDDPDDASLDLGPEPRQEATQNFDEDWDYTPARHQHMISQLRNNPQVIAAVARHQAYLDNPENDPTYPQDRANFLSGIAQRHAAEMTSGAGGVEDSESFGQRRREYEVFTAGPSPPEQTSPEVIDSAARAEARLERSLARRRCDVCGLQAAKTERPFQVCNGCRGRRYCSRECQKADWASHKQSCAGYNADV